MPRPIRLHLPPRPAEPLSHYWFRYPARFHPRVAQALLSAYSNPGDRVLDPFCGSGSILVEALTVGRAAVGRDIDPLAVFASRVKTRTYDLAALSRDIATVFAELERIRPSRAVYETRRFRMGSPETAKRTLRSQGLKPPPITNIFHWFRPYVVVDLARIADVIRLAPIAEAHRDVLKLAFASSIRASSNADPVPVSGLEVTSHMKRLDAAGRLVDPFANFARRLERILESVWQQNALFDPSLEVSVRRGDATSIASHVRYQVDAVITSPPYHNAVDYHRRHQLELFWLGFVSSQDENRSLRSDYIGKPTRQDHRLLKNIASLPALCRKWHDKMAGTSKARARAFAHYVISMERVFRGLAAKLESGRPAVFVVGHSRWNGDILPTSKLFCELAGDHFALDEYRWYPLENRYMSYARRNSANIDKEYVLVFRKK